MLRRAPTMSDNQWNARVMWSCNDTHNWSKRALTKENESYIKAEARRIDANGENKRLRIDMNETLERKAAAGEAKKAKSIARQGAAKSKLDGIQLVNYLTYKELVHMRVSNLDLQIDKLRAMGNTGVHPKSTLRNKEAKVKEILAGLACQKINDTSTTQDTQDLWDKESESLEPNAPASGKLPAATQG
ncbi:hypothetical protein RSOL_295350, partial [Rhizoctonia solani AG-3 Rhs1AP]